MSTTTFVEATSADPFIRDLHRKAVRLLNDPSLDRKQREFHMMRLQSSLIEHQAMVAVKAEKLASKSALRERVTRANRNQGVADPSQVVARRKEFVVADMAPPPAIEQAELRPVSMPQRVTVVAIANDRQVPERSRSVLTLNKA